MANPGELSDADVFGSGTAAASAAPASGELSDADVFGAPKETAPQGFMGSVKDVVKSIPSSAMRGVSDFVSLFGPMARGQQAEGMAMSGASPEDVNKIMWAPDPSSADVQKGLETLTTGPLYKPQTEAGKIVGSGVAAATNPTSYLAPSSGLVKAGLAMLGGMGSEVGGEYGGTPGAIIGGLTAASAPSAVKGALSAAQHILQPLTESGQQTIAGQVLARRASDVDAVRATLAKPPPPLVPGSEPTTFQLTGDMGLGSLERETATKNPQEFMTRRAEQNAARVDQISNLQAGGDPMEVTNAVRGRLSDIDQMTQAAVDSRLGEAQAHAGALGGTQNQEAYGNSLRTILQDAETAARTNERGLWNAVDPDGDLTVNMNPVRAVVRDFYGNLSQAAQSTLKPVEQQVLGVVGQYGNIEPFRELTDLRSLVSSSMREELSANGRTPAYGRLSQLRGGIENAINSTVGNRAIADAVNVAAGRLAPENSLAANINRQIAEWRAGRENPAISSATANAAGTSTVSSTPGGGGTSARGPGNAPGNQGVQGPPITANFDDAAAQRLRAATAATAQRAQTFNAQPIKSVLQRSGAQGPYNLRETAVPAKVFHPGDTGFEDVNRYRAAVGDGAALPALQDYAASSLREAALTPEGTIDPAKFARWQAQHSEAMRAFPDLAARFSDAAAATNSVGDVMRLRQQALQAAQQGPLGTILKATNPQDIANNVGAILAGRNAVRDMEVLVAQLRGNPDAMEGLRKAVADHITRNFISNTEAGTSRLSLVKSDAFQTFMRKNGVALEQVFSPDQLNSMRAIAADLQRTNRSVTAVKLPGQSNTAQDVSGVLSNATGPSLLGRIVSEGTAVIGGFLSHGVAGSVLAEIPVRVTNALRLAGYNKVDDLVKQAMLNPDLARVLLAKVPPSAASGAWQKAAARRIMQVSAATAGAAQAQQQNRGGRVVRQRADGGPVDDPKSIGGMDPTNSIAPLATALNKAVPNLDTSDWRPSTNIEDVRNKPIWRKAIETITRKPLPGDQTNYANGGEVKATKMQANYRGGTENKRCGNCKMFVVPDSCTAVRGKISPRGLCDFFESAGAKSTNGGRIDNVKIDATHDGPWMSCMSIDGGTMYRNENIPATANIKGKTVDVDEMLLFHEVPERADLEKLIKEFKERFHREPNVRERKAIYLKAHNRSGTPNERAHAKKIGVDWKAWSAWCRGEEAKIEKRPFTNQPKDADVKPIPHSHGDLEAMDHASAA